MELATYVLLRVGVVPAGLFVGTLMALWGRRRAGRARAAVARELGLRYERPRFFTRGRISGTYDGVHVEVGEVRTGYTTKEVIKVGLPPSVLQSVSFHSKGTPALGKLIGLDPPETTTGDPEFDAEVRVTGTGKAWASAVLDAPTRRRMRDLIRRQGFRLSEGCLERATEKPMTDADILLGYLRDAVAVARASDLRDGPALRDKLARNAREDPIDEVRIRCLQALCSSVSDRASVESVCRQALSDRSPKVRLEAARGLGEQGLPALEDLLRRRGCPDSVARTALERLLSFGLKGEVVLPHLLTLLDSTQTSARHLAIETLGRMRYVPALERLVLLLVKEDTDTGTAVAVAYALGDMGDASVVPSLTGALEAHPHDSVLRAAVRDAVRAIQARLVGADAGQLSLPEAPAATGDLSLADVAEDERGRVSLETSPSLAPSPAAAPQMKAATGKVLQGS